VNANNRSDQELLSEFKEGSNAAMEVLIKRHERRVYTYILLMVHNQHLAEDLMQETFVKAIKSVRGGKYSENNRFQSWLLRIAHNLVIDYFRQKSHFREVSNEEYGVDLFNTPRFSEMNAEQQMVYERVMAEIRMMIDGLPASQREVVMLRYYADMSFKEIADITNVSINTALGRMRYALINLKKVVREKNLCLEY
jgi:RNA polymerase sigma-70 factor (ECF subfamily)